MQITQFEELLTVVEDWHSNFMDYLDVMKISFPESANVITQIRHHCQLPYDVELVVTVNED